MNSSNLKSHTVREILGEMERVAKEMNAPVYRIERELHHNSWLRFIFVVLSSRTKDETTLKVVKKLKDVCDSWDCIRGIGLSDLAEILKGVGFHKQKASYLKAISYRLKGKEVVCDYNKLISLPGIGRKIANVILADICGNGVIGVDTHVHRISNRLWNLNTKKPEHTEKILYNIIPKDMWGRANKAMVGYGQTICLPKKPKCEICSIKKYCNSAKQR